MNWAMYSGSGVGGGGGVWGGVGDFGGGGVRVRGGLKIGTPDVRGLRERERLTEFLV